MNGAGEARKIQFTGRSTYTISLPKDWVKEMNLKKGDIVTVLRQSDGTILVSPGGSRKPEAYESAVIEISVGEGTETILRKVISSYLVGYEKIQIRLKDSSISSSLRNAIQDFTRRMLVGTEIVSDSPNEITLQVLLSYPELSVKSALRRMSFIATYMHEDSIKALKNLDQKSAREVIAMDDEVDRFNHYIIRLLKAAVTDRSILKEIGLSNAREILGYRLITKSVERMADHAVRIAKEALELKEEISSKTLREICLMSRAANKVFKESVEALFKEDFDSADKVVEEAKKVALMEEEVIKAIARESEPEAPSLRLITESIRRTAEYASDIAEIVLNMTIKSILEEKNQK